MPIENTPPLSDSYMLYESLEPMTDVLEYIPEAKESPTTLETLLRDPTAKGTSRRYRSRSRSRPRGDKVMCTVLEQERDSQHFKALMNSFGDRLERETQRADQAEGQVEYVRLLVKDAEGRVEAERAACALAEEECRRWKEECKRWEAEVERTQKEFKRRREQEMRIEAERREEDVEEMAWLRKELERMEVVVEERRNMFEERERVWRRMRDEWIDVGRDGGYADGYERGWVDGREQGLRQGRRLLAQDRKQRTAGQV